MLCTVEPAIRRSACAERAEPCSGRRSRDCGGDSGSRKDAIADRARKCKFPVSVGTTAILGFSNRVPLLNTYVISISFAKSIASRPF
jgi:hypothetical protein